MNEQLEDKVATDYVETTVVESSVQPEEKIRIEEFKISSDALVGKVKDLLRQGNLRYIVIKTEKGRTLVEVPLTVGIAGGVLGTIVFPVAAAIAAIGTIAARLTIVIARKV